MRFCSLMTFASTLSFLICQVAILFYPVCILIGLTAGKEIHSAPNGRETCLFVEFN